MGIADWFLPEEDRSLGDGSDRVVVDAQRPAVKAGRIQRFASLFSDPNGNYATLLVVAALDLYGTECLEWTQQTLAMQLEDDLHAAPSPQCLDQLMAGIAVLTTDDFRSDVSRFIQLCNVLCGSRFDPAVFDPATIAECAWGVTEVELLYPADPDDPDDTEFSPEIVGYVWGRMKAEGLSKPPKTLAALLRGSGQITPSGSSAPAGVEEDPAMFSAFYKTASGKSDEVDAAVNRTMLDLLTQLASLPLATGDAAKIAALLTKGTRKS